VSYRILVTGSRQWKDGWLVEDALLAAVDSAPDDEIVVVHGAAKGFDTIADEVARDFGLRVEAHRAQDHPDPLARNQHMVDLGADICLAFALDWASGTGHCARRARQAGIPTIDYGVNTE